MASGETGKGRDGWDEFVQRANEFIGSGELEKHENDFKRAMACNLRKAREALLTGTGNLAELVEKGLTGNLIYFGIRMNVRKWMDKFPDEAKETLSAIWTKDDLTVDQRIHAFCEEFPREVIGGAAGTLTNLASVLLMALDVERYPPYRIIIFNRVYKLTGYNSPDQNADEAALYRHALGFLDRFIEEAAAHGVHLRHRLDAQSLIWRSLEKKDPFDLSKLGPLPTPCDLQKLANDLLLNDPTVPFLEDITTLLYDKRQVIFQGPPGTGKTYVAQALAKCLAGSEERVTLVQFHPSYAYEDFVRGFRPTITENGQAGFELRDGPLLHAAQDARNEPDAKHFLLIDEINRGNLAKVFGELYFLLEYRDKKIRMQYQQEGEPDFSLPPNLYIIGTMNTADRSIALVDLALRRRFYFVEFHPDDEPVKGVLRRWLGEGSDMEWVADVVDAANNLLKDDKHAAIGPSYFMKGRSQKEFVRRIWKHSVLPYIEERLFGDDNRLDEFDLDKLKDKAAQTRKQKENQEQTDGTGEGETHRTNA